MKLFTQEELVSYLRSAVFIENEEEKGDDGLVEDTAYLAMSDEDILLFIRVAVTRDFSEYSLGKIPEEAVWPVLLIARRDLYFKLATAAAPLYNLQADGASLSQDQRFQHYMQLIQQLDKEFEDYENNGGLSGTNGTLESFNAVLSDRYNTTYNQRAASPPAVVLYLDAVGEDYVELSWKAKRHTTDFSDYKIYISEDGAVFDEYQTTDREKISSKAVLAKTVKNIWQTKCRVTGLSPDTSYNVGIVVRANGGKCAYDSDSFTTEDSSVGGE